MLLLQVFRICNLAPHPCLSKPSTAVVYLQDNLERALERHGLGAEMCNLICRRYNYSARVVVRDVLAAMTPPDHGGRALAPGAGLPHVPAGLEVKEFIGGGDGGMTLRCTLEGQPDRAVKVRTCSHSSLPRSSESTAPRTAPLPRICICAGITSLLLCDTVAVKSCADVPPGGKAVAHFTQNQLSPAA